MHTLWLVFTVCQLWTEAVLVDLVMIETLIQPPSQILELPNRSHYHQLIVLHGDTCFPDRVKLEDE